MGAGKEPAGRAEPSVPPVPEKKKKKKTSSRTGPEASAPETSAPPPPPETSAPEATGPTPTPPPTEGASATALKPPPASLKITDYLKPGASRGKATDGSASSGSQPLVLHTGPAAMVVQDKPSGLLGRIVELKRGGQDLVPLLPYAQRWNAADISAATRGLGKDRLPAPDPAGPRSTEEHFKRLKRAVKEFDSACTADARKALFEELLWEHRSLAEAHSKCLAIPEASIEALKDQVAKLQAEKEQLIRDHQEALDAQRDISRELKDQAMQAAVRYAEELKAAEAAAEAELEESAKALKAAEGKAAKAHKAAAEEARKAQKAAESEVARLKAEQKEYDLLVARTDALALRLFPDSQAHALKKVAEHRAKQAGDNLGAP
nr:formin-like protein 15 [Lolium perenne]